MRPRRRDRSAGHTTRLDRGDGCATTRRGSCAPSLDGVDDVVPAARTVLVACPTSTAAALRTALRGVWRRLGGADPIGRRRRSRSRSSTTAPTSPTSRRDCGLSIDEVDRARTPARRYSVGVLRLHARAAPTWSGCRPQLHAAAPIDAAHARSRPDRSRSPTSSPAVYPTRQPGRLAPARHTDGDDVRCRPPTRRRWSMPGRPRAVRRHATAMIEIVDQRIGRRTFQDLGRPGCAHLGVGRSRAPPIAPSHCAGQPAGRQRRAARRRSRRAAAWSCGCISRRCSCVTGRAGADRRSTMVRRWARSRPTHCRPARRSRVGARTRGLRTYLAVRGGFDVEPVLGSRSLDTLAGLGPSPPAGDDRCRSGRSGRRRSSTDLGRVPPPARRRRPARRARASTGSPPAPGQR